MSARYDQASLLCARVKPNELLMSSAAAGWTSMLLDLHRGRGQSDVFETHPTSDVTLVVALRGEHRIDVHKRGHWRSAVYQAGSAGLTASSEITRMRWSNLPEGAAFDTAHLYLPNVLFQDIREEYRRVGALDDGEPLSALAFRDGAIAAAVAALVRGLDAGAPDLYAEGACRWLAAHLLARHVGLWEIDDDPRRSGPIADRRLARVVEYMSAHLSSPLDLTGLAREAGISVHHFGRRFREQTGSTPFAYLTALRMAEARRLLRTTDRSVAQIASACGYGRPAAFASAFLRHVGTTPRSYRGGTTRSS